MCMCLHSCKTDCLPQMWRRDKARTGRGDGWKKRCCLGKHLSVISEHLPKQNGTWSENRKLHKQHSSNTNIPCYLPIATPEIEHGHGCLLPLRRLEDPTREKKWIFSFKLNNKVWGKRQTAVLVPIWWPDERLQCPLIAQHVQAWKESQEACPGL